MRVFRFRFLTRSASGVTYSSAHARYTKIVCYNSKDAQKINHTGNNDVNMSQGNVCPKVSQKRNSYTVCHEEETQFGEIEYFLCVSVFGYFKVYAYIFLSFCKRLAIRDTLNYHTLLLTMVYHEYS